MKEVVRVFVGYDDRQPLAYNVMRSSIERYGGTFVSVRGLFLEDLPITRRGASTFTFSRFLVPWLCNYEGYAIFCDQDQVVRADISELLKLIQEQPGCDAYVNKDQPTFEWASVIVFDCARCKKLTPEYVETASDLFSLGWAEKVGALPVEWNHPVGIAAARTDAKLYHFTQGIPYWPECKGLTEDQFWFEEYHNMNRTVDWIDMHRNTKHYPRVMQRFLKKYGLSLNGAPDV